MDMKTMLLVNQRPILFGLALLLPALSAIITRSFDAVGKVHGETYYCPRVCRGADLVLDQGRTIRVRRRKIESFAAEHQSVINFMPVEGRVYFVRDPPRS